MLAVASALVVAVASALPPPPTIVEMPNRRGTVKLDHPAHLARRARCKTCHGEGRVSKIQFTREWGHSVCLECHVERQASTRCDTCHGGLPTIVEAAPSSPAAPAPAATSEASPPSESAVASAAPAGASAAESAPGGPPVPDALPVGAPQRRDMRVASAPARPRPELRPPRAPEGSGPAAVTDEQRDVPLTLMLSTTVSGTRGYDGHVVGDVMPEVSASVDLRHFVIGLAMSADPFPRAGGDLFQAGLLGGMRRVFADRMRLHLVGEAGVGHHALRVPEDPASSVHDRIAATLAYLGGQVGLAYAVRPPSAWLAVSGFARTTLGSASGTYAVERCVEGTCAPGEGRYRFGGTTFGIVVGLGFDVPIPVRTADPLIDD